MTPKKFNTVLLEGVVVGILLILFVYVSSYLLKLVGQDNLNLPEICKTWNKHYIMEKTIFLSGLLFHLSFEYTGLNKWYVDSYYA